MDVLLRYTPGLLDLAVLVFALAVWPLILLSRKQPVAMLAWLLGVTFIPVLGPLFFILFGQERRLPGLPRKKERSRRAIRDYLDSSIAADPKSANFLEQVPESVRTSLAVAEQVGLYPLTGGNRFFLLNGAGEKYKALLCDIEAATNHVHLEYFKLRDDRFGQRFAEALRERARAGCEVRLLLDGVGSMFLGRSYIARLREAGILFQWFHPLNPFRRRWSLNIRNHRKIVVIDGQTGYLGGINLGDEYLGLDAKAGEWHDLAVRVEGPVVHSLQRVFSEDWHFATGELLIGAEHFPEMDSSGKGALAQVVNSMPSDELVTEMHQIYFSLLTAARRRAWLMTPYFLPDESIQTALAGLALGGVDVRVIVPQRLKEWIVGVASRSFFAPMLETGVRIFTFRKDAMLHAKALLIDDALTIIGSANLDQRSFHINFETGALIYDEGFSASLEGYFLDKMSQSRELSLSELGRRSWAARTLDSVARLAAPLF